MARSKPPAPSGTRSWCTWRRRRCAIESAGCCEFEHGPSMAAETARRLACDASVVMLTENEDGEPLNVGRKTRTISAPLRRALKARDKGCRFPGCANSRYMDAHHIDHWANGGETKPSNLISLCRFHHRAVHEGGIRIERLDDGALRFVKANGRAVDDVAPGFTQPRGDWTANARGHARESVAWRADGLWPGHRRDDSEGETGTGRSSWNVDPRLAAAKKFRARHCVIKRERVTPRSLRLSDSRGRRPP